MRNLVAENNYIFEEQVRGYGVSTEINGPRIEKSL